MEYQPYRLFSQNLRRHYLAYSVGALAMLITSLSEVFLPKYIQWAIEILSSQALDHGIPTIFLQSDPHKTLNWLVTGLVFTLIIGWIGRIGWRQILARQSHLAGHNVKTRLWSVLKDQALSLTDRYSLGDLMNRATADWNKTRFIHGFTIVLTFDLIFFSSLSIISMLIIHVKLTLICLFILPFLPRRIISISKQESRLHQIAQEQLSLLSDLISQSIKTIRLQRATASEEVWLEKLGLYAHEYAGKQYKVLKASWQIFVLGALPTIFAYAVLFTYGILKVQAGELSLGAFIALQSYVLLLQSPLFELGSLISEWQTGFASYQRIAEIYNLERPIKTTSETMIRQDYNPDLSLRVQNLCFSYDGQHYALKGVDLTIKSGEKIGLIGPIGSGKSTLVNIIGGLLENPKGIIEIHGIPLDHCQRDWIVKQLTMVPQKPFFFAGTFRHNLAPAGALSEATMIEALQAVELWDEIQKLPDGLNSWVGELGVNLSGGQKQRLSLARALLKPASILILDDCLSAVDSVTEAKILQNLRLRLPNQTMIWTAHRQLSLQICDRILMMSEGQITAIESEGKYNTKLPISLKKSINYQTTIEA